MEEVSILKFKLILVLLFLFSFHVHAADGPKIPYSTTITPVAGRFYPKETNSGMRNGAPLYGGYVDLLRTLSLGAGGYQVNFAGYGWMGNAQLTLLPYALLHPYVAVRWYGRPLDGHTVIAGMKLGQWP